MPGPRRPAASALNPVQRASAYRRRLCGEVEARMGEGYSLTAYAGLIGVSRATLNRWMDAHPAFKDAVARGRAKRLAFWEAAALDVARKGGRTGSVTVIALGLKSMGPE